MLIFGGIGSILTGDNIFLGFFVLIVAFVIYKFVKPKETQGIITLMKKIVKKGVKRKETQEEKEAKNRIDQYVKSQPEEPLDNDSDKHFLRNWAMNDGCYGITPYSNLKNEELLVPRERLIKNVIDAKFNVDRALDELVEEIEVREEARRMKVRDKKLRVKEKAERSVYGKVKSKRLPLNKEEKEAIFRKFDNKCAICGKIEGLHIHHKDKNPKNNRIDNLIVLCGVCHKKIHMKVR